MPPAFEDGGSIGTLGETSDSAHGECSLVRARILETYGKHVWTPNLWGYAAPFHDERRRTVKGIVQSQTVEFCAAIESIEVTVYHAGKRCAVELIFVEQREGRAEHRSAPTKLSQHAAHQDGLAYANIAIEQDDIVGPQNLGDGSPERFGLFGRCRSHRGRRRQVNGSDVGCANGPGPSPRDVLRAALARTKSARASASVRPLCRNTAEGW